MFNEGIKLFSKFITILFFVFMGQINGFAQTVNEEIDISEEFMKIEKYNEYIKTANYYHHADQKRLGKDVSWFLVGLSGAIGSVVLFGNENEDIQTFGGSALAGVSIATIWGALKEKGTYNYNKEKESLEEAKVLFKSIPNKK